MIKSYKKRYSFFLLIIVIFLSLNFFYKPRPKLSKIFLKVQYTNLLDKYNSEHAVIDINSNDNRVTIGEPYYLMDKTDWYQVNLLSFWRKEYLNLFLVDQKLKNDDFKIKIINNNNYAQLTHNNKNIVYACIDDPENFYYQFNYNNIKDTSDFNYWKQVFINNIKLIFNYFKPINYECLLVITSDIDLFEKGEEEINEKIFGKFIFY